MPRRPTITRRPLASLASLGLALAALSPAAASAGTLKLPAARTSSTGNYFTLEAYDAPSASKPDAEFEMKVCTSSHTPPDTALDAALFTLDVSGGSSLTESPGAAKSPAIVVTPLRPKQCTEGWLGFAVPKGKTVETLVYDHNGTISWKVG